MKIVFAVGEFRFIRTFATAIRLLAEAGHRVHLVADQQDEMGGPQILERLVSDYPELITHTTASSRRGWVWYPLAMRLRQYLDACRYLDRRYDKSPSLRHRAVVYAPALARRLAQLPVLRDRLALVSSALVRRLERALPYHPFVERLLRSEAPDVLIVTPLVYFASSQVDYIRSARRLGIPSGLAVASWDHLTTKGSIHEQPDRVFVWNAAQAMEAQELHGIPTGRVIVTGAPGYDEWFSQKASRSRAEFCRHVGFVDDRPFLLYVCSAPFIAPFEAGFVRRLLDAIKRSRCERLATASCLIRPHPFNADQWRRVDVSRWEGVSVWPRGGAAPTTAAATADYYDAVFHSAAVVGVNTSALIEAGIVGRPVYTVLVDEFAGQQQGTLHFQHLKNIAGGLLHVATTLDEHLEHLAAALETTRGDVAVKSRLFTESFIRPHGLHVSSAERFAEEVLALGRRRHSPSAEPWSDRLLRPVLFRAASLTARRSPDSSAARSRGERRHRLG